ncbi:MAG: hypothetical protein WC505_06015 [Patescibacteria group bacterium]
MSTTKIRPFVKLLQQSLKNRRDWTIQRDWGPSGKPPTIGSYNVMVLVRNFDQDHVTVVYRRDRRFKDLDEVVMVNLSHGTVSSPDIVLTPIEQTCLLKVLRRWVQRIEQRRQDHAARQAQRRIAKMERLLSAANLEVEIERETNKEEK